MDINYEKLGNLIKKRFPNIKIVIGYGSSFFP
jgi:hypothetical protein